jgi:hypothetical protein
MPMPSLFKYFAFVGAALLGLLSLTNFLLDPSTGATAVSQQTPAKPTVTVQHDPRASRIERWRNEQAALKASEPGTTIAKPAPQPVQPQPVSASASEAVKPIQVAAAPAAAPVPAAVPVAAAVPAAAAPVAAAPTPAVADLQTTDASAAVASDEAAEAARVKAEKKAAAKARKAKLARDRARAEQAQAGAQPTQPATGQFYGGWQQRNASNQQDQYYYGQRAPQQRQSYNAYAPRQGFGPFSQW